MLDFWLDKASQKILQSAPSHAVGLFYDKHKHAQSKNFLKSGQTSIVSPSDYAFQPKPNNYTAIGDDPDKNLGVSTSLPFTSLPSPPFPFPSLLSPSLSSLPLPFPPVPSLPSP